MPMPSPNHPVLRELILDGLGNLQALKGRTLLALVGIAMGTAAVIAMLHIGYNARAEAMHRFESLGIDRVSITPLGNAKSTASISEGFARGLLTSEIGLAAVAPIVQSGATIRIGRAMIGATLIAAGDGIYALTNAVLTRGRTTSDFDGFASYVVLGAGVAREIQAASGRPSEVGDRITVQNQVMTVVGLLGATDSNIVLNVDLNQSIVVPFAAARRLLRDPEISSVAAQLAPGVDERDTTNAITEAFRRQDRNGGNIRVQTARQLIAGLDQQMRVYGLLLLAIGTVSLLVGGVGVMNVMLMSVMERRREIGVRMAVGARGRDIATMFVTESLLLSAIGSGLGTVVGTAAGWIFAYLSGWHFEPAPTALPLGIGMAVVVGIFFGLYPAMRAARLDPIHALRTE
jgi:putative ABC transport system permease protein